MIFVDPTSTEPIEPEITTLEPEEVTTPGGNTKPTEAPETTPEVTTKDDSLTTESSGMTAYSTVLAGESTLDPFVGVSSTIVSSNSSFVTDDLVVTVTMPTIEFQTTPEIEEQTTLKDAESTEKTQVNTLKPGGNICTKAKQSSWKLRSYK